MGGEGGPAVHAGKACRQGLVARCVGGAQGGAVTSAEVADVLRRQIPHPEMGYAQRRDWSLRSAVLAGVEQLVEPHQQHGRGHVVDLPQACDDARGARLQEASRQAKELIWLSAVS